MPFSALRSLRVLPTCYVYGWLGTNQGCHQSVLHSYILLTLTVSIRDSGGLHLKVLNYPARCTAAGEDRRGDGRGGAEDAGGHVARRVVLPAQGAAAGGRGR